MQQANSLITGIALAVLGQVGQQFLVVSGGAKGQREKGCGLIEAGSWRNNARAGGCRLAGLGLINQRHLSASAGEMVGRARANDPAPNDDAIVHSACSSYLISRKCTKFLAEEQPFFTETLLLILLF